ncbi:protein of unknown function [Methanoculleus bourgensis]|uniref:Uncharacterized protein n=1 Tax=Methanoculleus bourgensis TaxID=83986 RepID=A0A0X8XYP8_9EURY|nr:protein of unknown function [Methanoculleus bourgensis]
MVSDEKDARGSALRWLQWSHVFSDMVSVRYPEAVGAAQKASMEPCLFRHGKILSVTSERAL